MDLPIVDLFAYLSITSSSSSAEVEDLTALCSAVSISLKETGVLLVKDPRCTVGDNDRFLDTMERYFERSDEFKRLQERTHLHYQVGVTPEGVEVPRSLVDEDLQKKIRKMPKEFQPSIPRGPDPKWQYMWRVGPRPENTRFKFISHLSKFILCTFCLNKYLFLNTIFIWELKSEPVIPEGFPEWKETMDSWGYKMISSIAVVALRKDAFTSLMKQGSSPSCTNRK